MSASRNEKYETDVKPTQFIYTFSSKYITLVYKKKKKNKKEKTDLEKLKKRHVLTKVSSGKWLVSKTGENRSFRKVTAASRSSVKETRLD